MGLEKRDDVLYVLNDKNKDIYYLWKDAQTVPVEDVKSFVFEPSKDLFNQLKETTTFQNKTQRFFRNMYVSLFSWSGSRTGFSPRRAGILFIKYFEYLKQHLKGVKIYNQDYKTVIRKFDSKETIMYLDPPYYELEKYYTNLKVDINDLADFLKTIKGKFVMSYNNVPEAIEAFKDFKIFKLKFRYKIGREHTDKYELIIMNF